MVDRVIELATDIVQKQQPKYGYVDVGDVLIAYLQNRMTENAAIRTLTLLEQDYSKDRP